MSPRPLRPLLGLLCVAVLATACSSETTEPPVAEGSTPGGSTPGTGSTPATDATTPPASDRSTPPVAGVLTFTAPKLGGGTIEGADFAGRDVAFWFWAPW